MRMKLAALLAIGVTLAVMPAESHAQKRQRDRITRDEIMASPQKDLDMYQVIRAIRPHFLEPPKGVRTLGNSFVNSVAVYVDGKKDTGLDALRLMSPAEVEEVRYLEPNRSESEFGPSANGGAIVIKRTKVQRVIPAGIADTTRPPAAKPPHRK